MAKIYQLESSGGKNDSCVDRGLGFNGYGFGIHKTAYNCYNSRETVKKYVTQWVQDKLDKGYKLNELLCYYNLGRKLKTCKYAENYQNL